MTSSPSSKKHKRQHDRHNGHTKEDYNLPDNQQFTTTHDDKAPPSSVSKTSSKKRKIEETPSTASTGDPDMLSYTTPTGMILNSKNAANILMLYVSGFQQNSATFKLVTSYSFIPPSPPPVSSDMAEPSKSVRQHRPLAPGAPPPDSLFHCSVTFPELIATSAGIAFVCTTGEAYTSKQLARQAAHFETVKKLVEVGEISPDLVPTPRAGPPPTEKKNKRNLKWEGKVEYNTTLEKRSPGDESTLTQKWEAMKAGLKDRLPQPPISASGPGGLGSYDYLAESKWWDECPKLKRNHMFGTVLSLQLLTPHDTRSEELRPLLLLTSRPLPLFGANGELEVDMGQADPVKGRVDLVMRMVDVGEIAEWKWSKEKFDLAKNWCEKVVQGQLNKPVVMNKEAKWVFVPLISTFKLGGKKQKMPVSNGKEDAQAAKKVKLETDNSTTRVRKQDIDWKAIFRVQNSTESTVDLTDPSTLPSQVQDTMVSMNRADFSRRYHITSIRDDLNPNSPDPNHPESTLLETNQAGSSESDRACNYPEQPILECSGSSPAKSGGWIGSFLNSNRPLQYLIPEFSYPYFLPSSIFRAASALPSLLYLIDDLLISHELNQRFFESRLDPGLALQAITCASSKQNRPEQTYQRLELLGDTILKLISTLDLYLVLGPREAENETLHAERHLMVSNRSLMVNVINTGIVPYIRSQPRNLKFWCPKGWEVNIKGEKVPEAGQVLGDKVIADIAESLIGAAYLSSSQDPLEGAIRMMVDLKIPFKGTTCWQDIVDGFAKLIKASHTDRNSKLGAKTEVAVASSGGDWMKAFKPVGTRLLGYECKNEHIAVTVLSLDADPDRRIAFAGYKILGDALMDFFIVEDLWKAYPNLTPAALTNMKHSRHTDPCQAAFAAHAGLLSQLRDVDAPAGNTIRSFEKAMLQAKKEADAAMKKGENVEEYWHEAASGTYLGDIPEACLGAIFADSTCNIELCGKIYKTQFKPFFDRYCRGNEEQSMHPKSRFLELVYGRCPSWEITKLPPTVDGFGATVILHGREIGKGNGTTVHVAIRKACLEALGTIKEEGLENICDCKSKKSK